MVLGTLRELKLSHPEPDTGRRKELQSICKLLAKSNRERFVEMAPPVGEIMILPLAPKEPVSNGLNVPNGQWGKHPIASHGFAVSRAAMRRKRLVSNVKRPEPTAGRYPA